MAFNLTFCYRANFQQLKPCHIDETVYRLLSHSIYVSPLVCDAGRHLQCSNMPDILLSMYYQLLMEGHPVSLWAGDLCH